MNANNVHQYGAGYRREPAVTNKGIQGTPGVGSFLALALIGLSFLAWLQYDHIVVWMLEHGYAEEGSAGSLLETVRRVSMISGAVALAVAWRFPVTATRMFIQLAAVRFTTGALASVMGPIALRIWAPATVVYAAVRTFSRVVLSRLQLGLTTIGSALLWLIRLPLRGIEYVAIQTGAALVVAYHRFEIVASYAGQQVAAAANQIYQWLAKIWVTSARFLRAAGSGGAITLNVILRPVGAVVTLAVVLVATAVTLTKVQINRAVSYAGGRLEAIQAIIRKALFAGFGFISLITGITAGYVRNVALQVSKRVRIIAISIWSAAVQVVTVLQKTVVTVSEAVILSLVRIWLALVIGAIAVIRPPAHAISAAVSYGWRQTVKTAVAAWLAITAAGRRIGSVVVTAGRSSAFVLKGVLLAVVLTVTLIASAATDSSSAATRRLTHAAALATTAVWQLVETVFGLALTRGSLTTRKIGHWIEVVGGSVASIARFLATQMNSAVGFLWDRFSRLASLGWSVVSAASATAGTILVTAMRMATLAAIYAVLVAFLGLMLILRPVVVASRVIIQRVVQFVAISAIRMWDWLTFAVHRTRSLILAVVLPVGRAIGAVVQLLTTYLKVAARLTSQKIRYAWSATMRIIAGWLQIGSTVIRFITSAIASGVSAIAGNAWQRVRFVRLVIDTVSDRVLIGFALTAQAIALGVSTIGSYALLVMRFAGFVVSTVSGHALQGFALTAQTIALGVSTIGSYALLVMSFAGLVVSTVSGHALQGFALTKHLVEMALAVGAHTAVAVYRFLLPGIVIPAAVIKDSVSRAVRIFSDGTTTATGAITVTTASIYDAVVDVIRNTADAMKRVLAEVSSMGLRAVHPIWTVISMATANVVVGLSTVWQMTKWVLNELKAVIALLLNAPAIGASITARTLAVGAGTVPDIARFTVVAVRHQKGVSAMSETNLSRKRLQSLVVTVVIFSLIAAVPIRIFWPQPPEPTVTVSHWATGHLTREGLLKEMAEEFNEAGHRTESGTRIKVEVYDAPSELQGKYISELIRFGTRRNLHKETNGYMVENVPDPTIVTPSSAHWLVTLNHEVGRSVVDLDAARSIVQPVIGIVTYTEMARCLGWPQKEIGYQDIIDLRDDPLGWRKYDCASPEWGQKALLAFTDPITSSTGRSLHLALYSIAAGKPPEELTLDDLVKPEVIAYVKKFQGLIDHYQIGTTVLNTKLYQGPRYGHFFVMPEDNLIHLYEGTEKSYVNGIKTTAPPIDPGSMVMIYPKEGSMPRKNCACVVQADWVNEEQAKAAELWTDFILEEQQQRAFMANGFRPGAEIDMEKPENRNASKITSEFGLNPNTPKTVLNPSRTLPEVAAIIDANWETVKRPGIVTFVIDTSGSMLGGKIEQAKDGLSRALANMASNNEVGLITFDSKVNVNLTVGPLKSRQWDIDAAANKLQARGETALFDAIQLAIAQTDAAEGSENAIRAIVVLTDGQANAGVGRLDQIVEMGTRDESLIQVFDGREGSIAVDNHNAKYSRDEVIGLGPANGSNHEVQIFFIGIGEDADVQVGRILAEATGAEFIGVAKEDLAQAMEEFSKYF